MGIGYYSSFVNREGNKVAEEAAVGKGLEQQKLQVYGRKGEMDLSRGVRYGQRRVKLQISGRSYGRYKFDTSEINTFVVGLPYREELGHVVPHVLDEMTCRGVVECPPRLSFPRKGQAAVCRQATRVTQTLYLLRHGQPELTLGSCTRNLLALNILL